MNNISEARFTFCTVLPTRQHQELPALLYLLAKYCLHTLSKTLQADAKLSEAVVSDSDGTEFDKSETAYQNERLPKNVTAEKEVNEVSKEKMSE